MVTTPCITKNGHRFIIKLHCTNKLECSKLVMNNWFTEILKITYLIKERRTNSIQWLGFEPTL